MEPASIPQETQQISSHAAPSRESYITQGGHDISNTGVVADPNTEYGDEYGDYGGYDGGYEGEGLDNSGYSQVDQDGNKDFMTAVSESLVQVQNSDGRGSVW